LQVPAVILNAVKDPEEFHSPQPPEPFNPHRSNLCSCLSPPPTQRTVISTEAAHSLIVSSAVEKSASLRQAEANPNSVSDSFHYPY